MTAPSESPADRDGQRHDPPESRAWRRPTRYRRWMLFVLILLLAVGVLAVGGVDRQSAARRTTPPNWHLDPLTAPTPSTPNSYRIAPAGEGVDRDADAPTFTVSVAELAAAFDAVALGDDRVEVLAGSASDGFVTYVQRSAFFAFPDYMSVRFIEADGGGSTLAVFSRLAVRQERPRGEREAGHHGGSSNSIGRSPELTEPCEIPADRDADRHDPPEFRSWCGDVHVGRHDPPEFRSGADDRPAQRLRDGVADGSTERGLADREPRAAAAASGSTPA